jgi:chromosome segregation ATPase
MKRINTLEKRVSKTEKKYQETETAFNQLVDDCAKLDEFLRKNNTPKPEMQLLRAYLQQYEDERVAIERDIEYSYSQINDLKDDIAKGLYDETKRDEYLTSEETAAKTLEAKLDYFIDRFEKQSEFIKTIEKQ